MSVTPVALHAPDDSYARALPELTVRWAAATPPHPEIVVVNDALAAELGIDAALLRTPDGVGLLTGAFPPLGTAPVATVYAGHQFGNYNPRLGDGRALLLGDVVDTAGRPREISLKGSGPTPFARAGDGLAALGPMLREYVVSEAVHALGIPTTRALAVVATGGHVVRERLLPGAVLTRVAASHLRVGTFQYAAATGDRQVLRRLVDHAIARHHRSAADAASPPLALFEAVVAAQARLVAQWMGVGFVHGVLNTDNVTISGETIDYGPCAFMDGYDPGTVFSSIDGAGRYAYGNQPGVTQWNLARFAEALLPLLDEDGERAVAIATEVLDTFAGRYRAAWERVMADKLGLADARLAAPLVAPLLALLQTGSTDWTSFFRALSDAARGDTEPARALVVDLAGIDTWLDAWRALGPDAEAMDRVNPVYIPRNHLVEEALAAATDGDLTPLHALLDVLAAPFTPRPGLDRYAEPAPGGSGGYRTYCGT